MDLYSAVQVLFDFESFLHDQDQARDAGAGQASVLSAPPPPVLREAVDTFCGAVLSAADNGAACGAIRDAVCATAETLLPRLLGPDGGRAGRAGNMEGSEGPSWESQLAFGNGLMILSIALSGALSHPGCCFTAGAGVEPEGQGSNLAVQESCAATLYGLLHILLDVWPRLKADLSSRPIAFAYEVLFRFLRTVLLKQAPRAVGSQGVTFELPLSFRTEVFRGMSLALLAGPDYTGWFSNFENLGQSDPGLPLELARCLIAVTKAAAATASDDSDAYLAATGADGGCESAEDMDMSPQLDAGYGSLAMGGIKADEIYLRKNFAGLALLVVIGLRLASRPAFNSFCSLLALCPSYNNLDLISLLENPDGQILIRCVLEESVIEAHSSSIDCARDVTLVFAYMLFANTPSLVVRLDPLQQARLISSLLEKAGIASGMEAFERIDENVMGMCSHVLSVVLDFGCLGPMRLISTRPQLVDFLVGFAAKLLRDQSEAPSDSHIDLVTSLLNFFSADPKARHIVLRNFLRSGLIPLLVRYLEGAPPDREALLSFSIVRAIFFVTVGFCGMKKECVQHLILERSLTCLQIYLVALRDSFKEPQAPGDAHPDSLNMCCKLGAEVICAAGECKLWSGGYVLQPSLDVSLLAGGLRCATDILAEAIRPSAAVPACPLGVVLPWVQVLLAVHRILCEGMASVLREAREARKSRQAGATKKGGRPKAGTVAQATNLDLRQQFVRLSQCRREVSSLLRRMSREVLPEAERREAGRWEGVEEGEVAAALSLTG